MISQISFIFSLILYLSLFSPFAMSHVRCQCARHQVFGATGQKQLPSLSQLQFQLYLAILLSLSIPLSLNLPLLCCCNELIESLCVFITLRQVERVYYDSFVFYYVEERGGRKVCEGSEKLLMRCSKNAISLLYRVCSWRLVTGF